MKISKEEYPLEGFIDTHIHTAPDIKPRVLNDVEAAFEAKKEKMDAIVIKSHVESTAGRAKIAEDLSGIRVIGGVCLNTSVGGLNPDAVKNIAKLGGKVVWLPTISSSRIKIIPDKMEEILHIAAQNDLVLATGHISIDEIFLVLDMAKSYGIWRVVVNHPLTNIIGANIEDQMEMAKYGYLEHCFVACMPQHDALNPREIAGAIEEVGYKRCIMATDFGQIHNPHPTEGMKMFVDSMLRYGIKKKHILQMCIENPSKLFDIVI